MRLFFKKFKKIFLKESGQSLIEIVIALAIGAILIGGASTAVVVVLQSSKTSQIQQSATALAQGLVENVRVYSFADWSNIYGLNKTSSTVYFMHSSSTDNFHLEGKEGVVENGIKSGLVGHWKLDSASGSVAYDFSGNNNSGVLNNGVLRATSSLCQVGGCFEFDGTDDYVSVPDLGFSGDVSVSALAWIKVDEEAGTKNNIFGFGNAGNSNEVFSIRTIGNGAFRFYFWSNDLDVAVEPYYGTWTHVAAVYNASSSERYVYVNGVKAGSDTPTDPNFSDSNYRI